MKINFAFALILAFLLGSCSTRKKTATVQPKQHNQDIYYMPDVSSAEAENKPAKAEFRPFEVDREDGFYEVLAYEEPYPYTGVVLGEHPLVPKSVVKKAKAHREEYQGHPVVSMVLSADGARLFEQATEANIGKPIAIVIGGKVVSMPVVQHTIASGQIQISGNFTMAEVTEMAKILRN